APPGASSPGRAGPRPGGPGLAAGGPAAAGLPVGDPAAVEPERDPGGQVHPGDGVAGEVLGGQDDQVGGTAVGVVHEGHDVTVVLVGAGSGGCEHRLARGG